MSVAAHFDSRARTAVGRRLPGKVDRLTWRPDVVDDYVWDDLLPRGVGCDYLKHLGATLLAVASLGGFAFVSGHWPFSIVLGGVAALIAVHLIRRWLRYRDRL